MLRREDGLGASTLSNLPTEFVVRLLLNRGLVEWGCSGEEFVEQDAEAVDIRTRVDIQTAESGLLWTHVGRRPHQLHEARVDRLVGQLLPARCFGQAKVDYLHDRLRAHLSH